MKKNVLILVLFLVVIGCGPTKDDWIKVKQTNSIAEVKKFLEVNPRSKFDFEAKTILDSLEWDNTLRENTIAGYKSFIDHYPDSKNLNKAKENLNWTKAFQEKNDSLLSCCIKTYPNNPEVANANDLISQLKWHIYELKKADCVDISSGDGYMSYGLHIYNMNSDGSLEYQQPEKLPFKRVIIWRDFNKSTIDYAKENKLVVGVAYLLMSSNNGVNKFRYIKKVDLSKTDKEIAKEFGIN